MPRDRFFRIAPSALRESAEILEGLGKGRDAVDVYADLGSALSALGRWAEALDNLRRAVELVRAECRNVPLHSRPTWHKHYSRVYDDYLLYASQVLTKQGHSDLEDQVAAWAIGSWGQSLAEVATLNQRRSDNRLSRQYHAISGLLTRLGSIWALDEGLEQHQRARPRDTQRLDEYRTQRQIECADFDHSLRDMGWGPNAATSTTGDLRELAVSIGSAILVLRPTVNGTVALVGTPEGRLHTLRIKDFTSRDVEQLLVGHRSWGPPESGLMTAYHRWLADDDSNAHFDHWSASLESCLNELGIRLWSPLRRWLNRRTIYPRGDQHEWPCEGPPHQRPRVEPRPLVIIPCSGLHVLPIHAACLNDGPEGKNRACDDYNITYANIPQLIGRRDAFGSAHGLLEISDPTLELLWSPVQCEWARRAYRLWCTTNGQEPKELVLGPAGDNRATVARIKEELPHWPVVVAAMHARYSLTSPFLRAGLLCDGGSLLPLKDILPMDLRGVRVILLTACETAMADYWDGVGDAGGISATLLACGASTVVASQWCVDDLSSALLSRAYLTELFCLGGDWAPARALWSAQRWLRCLKGKQLREVLRVDLGNLPDILKADLDFHSRRSRPFSDPIYWAPFTSYGGL